MTSSPILFSEQQRFRQPWLWILLAGLNTFTAYALVQQLYFHQPVGTNPMSDAGFLPVCLLILGLDALFIFMRLDVQIQTDGVYYRFFPLQRNYRMISRGRISRAWVREYSPLKEYGGWGMRLGIFGKGQAFNVRGNKGLQLVYDNDVMFLLGTQKPEALKEALDTLGWPQ